MTDKELKKLRRSELLEIMLSLKSESDKLKQENEELRLSINETEIDLEKHGNIAEAALQISGVFDAAQKAADMYISGVRKMYDERERIISDAKAEAERIISDAKKYADEIRKNALRG